MQVRGVETMAHSLGCIGHLQYNMCSLWPSNMLFLLQFALIKATLSTTDVDNACKPPCKDCSRHEANLASCNEISDKVVQFMSTVYSKGI